jgi:cob(I)alamin adenosyltransferase
MKIYTKTGDDGTTGLFGGTRVKKNSLRIDAYGTVDELNAIIGIALTHSMNKAISEHLLSISSLLFTVGSDLATTHDSVFRDKTPQILQMHISLLEQHIDSYQADLPELKSFILPGGSSAAAHLHHARTVCRRAERAVVALSEIELINGTIIQFLNRLSDYLFVASRLVNFHEGIDDILWISSEI